MRAVNLLPRQETVEQASKTSASRNVVPLVAGIGGVAVVIALAAAFLVANGHVKSQRSALDRARTELARTPASNSGSLARNKLLSARERRAVALAAALSRRVAWDRVLRRVALVLPGDVWLTQLQGATPTSTTDAAPPSTAPGTEQAPTGLTLEGYSYSHAAVARLLSRLAVVPDLTNVQLGKSTAEERGGVRVVHFTVAADVRRGGEAR